MIFHTIGRLISDFMIKGIQFYQRRISPNLGSRCKYLPTCSQYAIEAIDRYGPFKGFLMAVWRVLRCNPFSRGGYDPVK
jgi:putative membrane protein insertion efficiency factor